MRTTLDIANDVLAAAKERARRERALLDVNVLIALLDADHASHRTALDWFAAHAETGWASCPTMQNGCVRPRHTRHTASGQTT